ncbi:NAD(P)-binding protein [Cadophora sp. DSE1049]|nr:NAD(P)-binding protein [Cadophora sp. DSE1049]
MAARIFITGITGYIGGQTLATLMSNHPSYSIVGLVRKEEQKQQILAKHPSIEIVIGDLDSKEVLIEQSKQADIVLHTADADHLGAITSLLTGLSSGKKGVYIHLSGAASIFDHSTGYGKLSPKLWDDIEDLHTITTFEEPVFHVKSDQLVLSLGKELNIKTALLVPPVVYGTSDSVKDRSISLPMLVDAAKERGKMFQIGEAENSTSTLHVKDLADVFVYFVDQALASQPGSKLEWGENGVYYIEAGEIVVADVVDAIAKEMFRRGMVGTVEVDRLSDEQALEIHPWALILWGANMRTNASRLRALGWVPKQPGIMATVAGLLK